MTKDSPQVGQIIKVHLPGESPWAECLSVMPDGKWVGRIDNVTVASSPKLRQEIADKFGQSEPLPALHSYTRDDLVVFHSINLMDGVDIWAPYSSSRGGC